MQLLRLWMFVVDILIHVQLIGFETNLIGWCSIKVLCFGVQEDSNWDL